MAGGSDQVEPGSRKVNININPNKNALMPTDDDLVLVKESVDPLDLRSKSKFSAIYIDNKDKNGS